MAAYRRLLLEAFSFILIGVSIAYILCNYRHSSKKETHGVLNGPKHTLKSAKYNKNTVQLLIIVFSQPQSFTLRHTLRKTWLSHNYSNVEYLFVVNSGHDSRLLIENQEYNDLLFFKGDQHHSSHSYPSTQLLAALTWVANHVKFRYLLKCNDVSYISIDLLLKNTPKGPMLVWGYFIGNQNVSQLPKAEHKWNLCSTYFPYAQGGGYIISQDIVTYIVQNGPYLYHTDNEDIGLGTWLSPLKNLTRYHDIRFNTGPMSRGCLNQYIISHPETVISILDKHLLVKNKGKMCLEENEKIPAYHYNWMRPIDLCCK